MPGEIDVIAIPRGNVAELHGADLEGELARVRAAAAGIGYQLVAGYASLADLEARVRAILVAQLGCLRTLEIDAHGNPTLADGVTLANAAAFGARLGALNLCDNVSVYLSGCNTGVNWRGGPSVAQVLSSHTPTEAADNVRVTVYGSVGYMSGTHAEGNGNCVTRTRTGSGKGKRVHEPYPASPDGRMPGSQAAAGAACFRGFREGRPV